MNKINFALTVLLLMHFTMQSQDFKFGKISKEELTQKNHPLDTTANAAFLYKNVETSFVFVNGEGFILETEVHERIKIYNKDGYDWGTKTVNLRQASGGNKEEISGLKAYTYFLDKGKVQNRKLKNDGIFEEKTSRSLSQTKFTMPNVQDGCIIEYKYKITSTFFSDQDEYRLQEEIPIDNINVKFSAPEYFSFKMHQKGWLPFEIKKETSTGKVTIGEFTRTKPGGYRANKSTYNSTDFEYIKNIDIVTLRDVPALKEEAYAGNINNFLASIKFELASIHSPGSTFKSYTTTWDAVTENIYKNEFFGGELKKSNYFEKDIDLLLKGVSNPNEKMIKIFDYVKEKMNWNGYIGYFPDQGLKNAYKKSVGNVADINLMLVAILKYSGINANPILLSTKANGIPLFPTRNGFNYVIAAVENEKEILLLDASNKIGVPNILEDKLLNWQGRLVRSDGSSDWVSLDPSTPAINNTMVSLEINRDLSLTGKLRKQITGHHALHFRKENKKNTKEKLQEKFEENVLQVSDIVVKEFENEYKPLQMSFSFEDDDTVEVIGEDVFFSPLSFLVLKESPFKSETRQLPIIFGYPQKERININIQIPDEYIIKSLPESESFLLGNNQGLYKYFIKQNDNTIQLSVERMLNQSMYVPEDYQGLKSFFEAIVNKESEKIVLTKA